MSTNAFRCSKCNEFTRHIEISFREFSNLDKTRGNGHHLFAAICDFTGFTKNVVNNISGWRYYKCCKCGEASCRRLDGTEP